MLFYDNFGNNFVYFENFKRSVVYIIIEFKWT
jgi:hypothetical protein